VEFVVREGPARLNELMSWGAEFDMAPDKKPMLALEGGHSERRVVHRSDASGKEILTSLLRKSRTLPSISLLNGHFVTDLITVPDMTGKNSGTKCIGARMIVEGSKEEVAVFSRFVFLATGGIGNVFKHTTNPPIATGDGFALAYRADARLKDLEFIQYHPTVFYDPLGCSSFLISEAVRGEGAVLRNQDGVAFMHLYDSRGNLAPRDIVSRSIIREIKKRGDKFVYLDCSSIPGPVFRNKFPNIYQAARSKGINLPEQMIPVIPAMHYLCGGILTGHTGRTSIGRLYAAGECACTGLHGSNRLASNSLLEALVFSHRSAVETCNIFPGAEIETTKAVKNIHLFKNRDYEFLKDVRDRIRKVMDNLGPLLSANKLNKAGEEIDALFGDKKLHYALRANGAWGWETRNMLETARLVISHSQKRSVNKGVFFNEDIETNGGIGIKYHETDINRS
jgi:L-aspartate oxidase